MQRGAKDGAQAARWERMAAEQGHLYAQANLSFRCYSAGDLAGAFEWCQRAADGELAWAQYNLGLMYQQGKEWPEAKPKLRTGIGWRIARLCGRPATARRPLLPWLGATAQLYPGRAMVSPRCGARLCQGSIPAWSPLRCGRRRRARLHAVSILDPHGRGARTR